MAIPVRRRAADIAAFLFASAATAFGLLWLFWILWTTLRQGAAALTPELFTQMTPPPGTAGGLLNAFYGSAIMVLLALVVGGGVLADENVVRLDGRDALQDLSLGIPAHNAHAPSHTPVSAID